ncbi:hypothetical protein R6Q59_014924 [Mikania micrantha]
MNFLPLDYFFNDFKGVQIPGFIDSLRNLRYLNMCESNINRMILPEIENISELRIISLRSLYGTSKIMKI